MTSGKSKPGGSGWGSEDLRTEVQRLGIADRVIFTGYVSDEEKAALLRAAAVYACPSLYEGFGLPVLEAQAMGVPVICSNTSSLPEVAGEGALLFDPQSVNEIGQALHQVLVDPSVRDRLIRLGHANVARFSWRDCAERILEKIEKAEGRRQKGEIENSKDKNPASVDQHGGIGLNNVKRRLELLYPGRHELKVLNDDEKFKVDLKIEI